MIYQEFIDSHKLESRKNNFELAKKYSDVLSDGLLEILDFYGFCKIDNGLAWLISPDQWQDILSDFLGPESSVDKIPFMRGAFGDIFYIDENQAVNRISPILGEQSYVTDSLDSFFVGLLMMKSYYDNAFFKKLFKSAYQKLGYLGEDECYGFEPLLSLGGSEDIENVVKVKYREYLSLIAQTL